MDEVQEYFKLPCENFDTCGPLQWWAGRRLQFPNLSRFARNILSIPGEFTTDFFLSFNHILMFLSLLLCSNIYVGSAVEQIFLGGCDTISLCHASLNPETIRTLMLVKQQLRLARTAVHDILRD
jgi:hypothetical protein